MSAQRHPLREVETNRSNSIRFTDLSFSQFGQSIALSSTPVRDRHRPSKVPQTSTDKPPTATRSKNAEQSAVSHVKVKEETALLQSFNAVLTQLIASWSSATEVETDENVVWDLISDGVKNCVKAYKDLRSDLGGYRPRGRGLRFHQGGGYFLNLPFAYFHFHRRELSEIPWTADFQRIHISQLQVFRDLAIKHAVAKRTTVRSWQESNKGIWEDLEFRNISDTEDSE